MDDRQNAESGVSALVRKRGTRYTAPPGLAMRIGAALEIYMKKMFPQT